MKFSEALQRTLDTGIGIFRPSWNGNGGRASGGGVAQWVAAEFARPDEKPTPPHRITTPYMYISQPNGVTPWVPSQGDLFAEDWEAL